MKTDDLEQGLAAAGLPEHDTEQILKLYENDKYDDVLHSLKRCRADKLAELHEHQKSIDVIDYLIRDHEKSIKETIQSK